VPWRGVMCRALESRLLDSGGSPGAGCWVVWVVGVSRVRVKKMSICCDRRRQALCMLSLSASPGLLLIMIMIY